MHIANVILFPTVTHKFGRTYGSLLPLAFLSFSKISATEGIPLFLVYDGFIEAEEIPPLSHIKTDRWIEVRVGVRGEAYNPSPS